MEAVTDLSNEVIKLTGKDVMNGLFPSMLKRLCDFDGFDVKTAYNISFISRKAEKFMSEMYQERAKLPVKYADKDEDGNIIFVEHNGMKVPSITGENEEKVQDEMNKLLDIDLEIRKRKLDVNELTEKGYKFTANDISVLEPLLCGLED